MRRDNDTRHQSQLSGASRKFFVVEGNHAAAITIAGVMQGVGEFQSGIALRQRTFNRAAVFYGNMRQRHQMPQDGNHFGMVKTVVAAHDPLELQNHGLANHWRLSAVDQLSRGRTLARRLAVLPVLDVVAGENVGIESNHLYRFSSVAGS